MISQLAMLATALVLQATSPGPLIIVGGGGTTDAIRARTLELVGGADARIVVVPFASRRDNAGHPTMAMWRKDGVREVSMLPLDDRRRALELLQSATLIWMPGGSQHRLMEKLREADLVQAIVECRQRGCAVGGTSAGAAVMSTAMLGAGAATRRLEAGGSPLGRGLGLLPAVIIDQHFHARRRFNRLLSAVLDQPAKLGMGIDERTAVIVRGRRFEVVGDSSVMIIDASTAVVSASPPGTPAAAVGVRVHVLRTGMSYSRPSNEAGK